jgi:hypothetical protein
VISSERDVQINSCPFDWGSELRERCVVTILHRQKEVKEKRKRGAMSSEIKKKSYGCLLQYGHNVWAHARTRSKYFVIRLLINRTRINRYNTPPPNPTHRKRRDFELFVCKNVNFRSQWPHGLRRGSVASGLLGLRVRIPPEEWMSVPSWVLCVVR